MCINTLLDGNMLKYCCLSYGDTYTTTSKKFSWRGKAFLIWSLGICVPVAPYIPVFAAEHYKFCHGGRDSTCSFFFFNVLVKRHPDSSGHFVYHTYNYKIFTPKGYWHFRQIPKISIGINNYVLVLIITLRTKEFVTKCNYCNRFLHSGFNISEPRTTNFQSDAYLFYIQSLY